MCGRYASTRSGADLATLFDAVDDTGDDWLPSYNVAPTTDVPVVRVSRSWRTRVVTAARWGLVPPWAKDPSIGGRMFNARAETVATKSAYRAPFAKKRCLVPIDGWFEWRKLATGGKQPYFLTSGDGSPLALAGLWEYWRHADETLLTCTILTTDAVGPLAHIHDRMPLLVDPGRYAAWLGEEDAAAAELLAPPTSDFIAGLEIRPVSRAVGNVRNDGPQLLDQVAEPAEPSDSTDSQSPSTLF